MIPQTLSAQSQLADILRRLHDLESSPNLYGATITGSLFQTATTDTGFKIATDGIRQYGTDGTVTSSWTDDGISFGSGTFVGGRFVTPAATGARIEIGDGGITQYDPDGTVASSWTTDGIDLAGASLSGGAIDGADITGTTFTGGLVRTAASGARIEIRPDLWPTGWEGIRFYDSTTNTGWPEIKTTLTEGAMYLTSGEVVTGTSGNAEMRLFPGGNWVLSSTHLAKNQMIYATDGSVYVTAEGGAVSLSAEGGDAHLSASGSAFVSAAAGDVNINSATGTAWLAADGGDAQVKASGTIFVASAGDVKISCGSSGGVYFTQTGPTVSGVAANVYMDPVTGQLSRIA